MNGNDGRFKKGSISNPKGRPPIILPEVQRAVEANRNALKVLILAEIEPKVTEWVRSIIDKGCEDGDVVKFKMLMEMALGKVIDDAPSFDVSDEEKLLVQEFRRRKSAITDGTGGS